MSKTHFIMFGGFLGAGKTSAMILFAQYLTNRKKSVGLVTNDQSVGLVDTARVRQAGFLVDEVTGSCFCCNFNELVRASDTLSKEYLTDVIIAEPVGSCTDLRATTSHPLKKLHGEKYTIAPLSVLVDPIRFGRVMGIFPGGNFSEKVLYIYRKQLEEADYIVINKIDLLDQHQRQLLINTVLKEFPRARLFEVSCHTGEGLPHWFEYMLQNELDLRRLMDIDYDIYAEGEALLGWLNTTVSISKNQSFNGSDFLLEFVKNLQNQLAHRQIEIAHLKVALLTAGGLKIGAVSLTGTDTEPYITDVVGVITETCDLMINLRAEADPDVLKSEVFKTLHTSPIQFILQDAIHAFRPGRPKPTHRSAYC